MKKVNLFLLGSLLLGLVITYSCNTETKKGTDSEKETAKTENLMQTKEDSIKRGEYLVTTMSCHDCHSPKIFRNGAMLLDSTRLLSGYPSENPVAKLSKEEKEIAKKWMLFSLDLTTIVGPWGRSFTANLTSDATGTGNWTQEQFITAIRKGKYKGMESNRSLLPPMPWEMYRNLTDDDLKTVFAYLKSTKPIKNVVPAPVAPADL